MIDYYKYQLQWMIDHEYSLDDLIELIMCVADDELTSSGSISNAKIIDEAYEIFKNECSFDGQMWASYDEWKNNEYKEEQ